MFKTLAPGVPNCSCSTQLRMKMKLLIESKVVKIKIFLALKLSDVVHAFILLINIKMPTIIIVGIFKVISRVKLTLS